MQASHSAFAPRLPHGGQAEAARKCRVLLPVFTPRTVFMEMGSSDCELSLRAASYVERVWCVQPQALPPQQAPCNLRCGPVGGVPVKSIHVAFSESFTQPGEVLELLAPGGVWFVYGQRLPARVFHEAGFARVRYFASGLRLPAALARLARTVTTAAYK